VGIYVELIGRRDARHSACCAASCSAAPTTGDQLLSRGAVEIFAQTRVGIPVNGLYPALYDGTISRLGSPRADDGGHMPEP